MTDDAVALAKAMLALTEEVGKQLCREAGDPVDENDTYTLDSLSPMEREGIIRTARLLIDRRIVTFHG